MNISPFDTVPLSSGASNVFASVLLLSGAFEVEAQLVVKIASTNTGMNHLKPLKFIEFMIIGRLVF